MSINHVTISGNLTRDAEIRQTQSGFSVLGFGVAVNERRKNQQTGQWEERPNFFDVTIFGNRANSLAQYLTKGTKVAISGSLRWSSWDKNGEKRSKVEIIAEEVEFLSARNDQQPVQYAPQPVQYAQQATQYAPQQYHPPVQQYAPQNAPQPVQQAQMEYGYPLESEVIPF